MYLNQALALCCAIFLNNITTHAAVIYVKTGGTGSGTSWAAAYGSLQSALNTAAPGDQVWVAQGTYTPSPMGNTDTSFYLQDGVSIYGGFAGAETTLSARADTTGMHTILSGNLGGGLHSKHVVYGVGTLTASAVLNGFTVSDGTMSLSGTDIYGGGAGMYNMGSPSLANVIFQNNTVNITITGGGNFYGGGAGVYTKLGNPQFRNIIFRNNVVTTTVSGTVGGYGGAGFGGAGMYIDSGNVALTGCKFDYNYATGSYVAGAGMLVSGYGCIANITNSLFTHNQVSGTSGGALAELSATVVATNVTFTNNSGYTLNLVFGNVTLQNTIVFGPTVFGDIYTSFCTLTTNYCLLLGTFPGTGNINVAYVGEYPDFIDTMDGYFNLKPCSAAVNAGSNSYVTTPTDLGGKTRIADGTVDMGAYEWQGGAAVYDTVYVNGNTTDSTADGSSWAHAFKYLQTALGFICPASYPHHVWVAAGTYVPTYNGDRTAAFTMTSP